MDSAEGGLPRVGNFGPKAVQRAIRNEALTHPATLYPGVVGILGGLAGFLFGSSLLLGVGFGAALLGLTGLTVNYFFRDKTFANRYIERLKQQTAAQEELLLKNLQEDLVQCRSIAGAEEYGEQALAQFTKIEEKYGKLNTLLEHKLGSGEFALGGIWAANEQVYLGVLENLKEIVSVVHTISTIDSSYIHDRLKKLSRLRKPTAADKREAETLIKRKRIRDEQLEKVNELLTRNEEALTQIEEATVAVAEIRADDRFTTIDTADSVQRLRELAGTIHERHRRV